MKLIAKPQIVDNRYSVIVKFKEYGSSKLTAEMEEKLIDDYAPTFKLSDLTFEGKYSVDSSSKMLIKDDISGETVKLSLPNREIKLGKDLEVGYTVHVKEIAESEIGSVLVDKDKVAQAKVQLFIDVIKTKIDETINTLAENLNNFEEEVEIEVG